MSTEEILATLCHNGTLKLFEPPLQPNESVYRRIYLRPSIHAWLHPAAGSPVVDIQYASDARRFLKGFVVGELFDDVEKLKNLDTDDFGKPDEGVYAIRIKRRPQTRIFGSFAGRNIFVGTHKYDRGDLPEEEWVKEKDLVKTTWSGSFKVIQQGTPVSVRTLDRLIGVSRTVLTDNVRP